MLKKKKCSVPQGCNKCYFQQSGGPHSLGVAKRERAREQEREKSIVMSEEYFMMCLVYLFIFKASVSECSYLQYDTKH